MTSATIQKQTACKTCPFIRNGDRDKCFDPDVLEETALHYMENGGIHPCHSSDAHMCAGYLQFAEQTLEFGAESLQMVRIASRLGMFDHGKIPTDLDVFDDVEEMLDDHRERFESNPLNRIRKHSENGDDDD